MLSIETEKQTTFVQSAAGKRFDKVVFKQNDLSWDNALIFKEVNRHPAKHVVFKKLNH